MLSCGQSLKILASFYGTYQNFDCTGPDQKNLFLQVVVLGQVQQFSAGARDSLEF